MLQISAADYAIHETGIDKVLDLHEMLRKRLAVAIRASSVGRHFKRKSKSLPPRKLFTQRFAKIEPSTVLTFAQ